MKILRTIFLGLAILAFGVLCVKLASGTPAMFRGLEMGAGFPVVVYYGMQIASALATFLLALWAAHFMRPIGFINAAVFKAIILSGAGLFALFFLLHASDGISSFYDSGVADRVMLFLTETLVNGLVTVSLLVFAAFHIRGDNRLEGDHDG